MPPRKTSRCCSQQNAMSDQPTCRFTWIPTFGRPDLTESISSTLAKPGMKLYLMTLSNTADSTQGKNRSSRPHHRRRRQPRRHLRHLRPFLRPTRRPQIRRPHRRRRHRRPLHPRQLHQLHHAFLQGTPPHHRHRPAHRRPSHQGGLVRQHPRHRAVRHRLTDRVCRCGDPDEQ